MIARIARVAPLAALVALAACATSAPPTRVTRFSAGQPITPGSVAIEPRDPAQASSLAFANVAGAVAGQLSRLGFRVDASATSDMVAVVDLSQITREGPPKPPAFSIGLGGGTFGRHVGAGGGVGIPIGHAKATYVDSSLLSVQLRRRSDASTLWEGRAAAETRGGTPGDAPGPLVQRLSSALFRDFPGASGQTVVVK